MYARQEFALHDPVAVRQLIAELPFGVLLTPTPTTLLATHLPLHLDTRDGQEVLRGHVARANPHWRALASGAPSLAILQGPHAYISPTWYAHPNVPTWNYVAVHVRGVARVVEADVEREAIVTAQVRRYEGAHEGRYRLEDQPPAVRGKIRGVVVVELAISEAQATLKLSQNRDAGDFQRVIDGLRARGGSGDREIAAWMERVRAG